jgi:hypothetical protein
MHPKHSLEQLHGTENDWAEKLKKEAEAWRHQRPVPRLPRSGVQIVRVPKKKGPALPNGQAPSSR